MAGPKPDDTYNSVPTVAPSEGMPNDYLSVRSNPNTFGAQIGGALQGAGQKLDQLGNQAVDVAIQRQGMLNETMATDAETQAASSYGSIMGKYKSMEGLEAVQQLPQTVQELQQVRQKIRSTLPNAAAQRSFDLLAARRESYALGDVNNYAATQIKQADTNSAIASIKQTIDSASSYNVASSDAQFNDADQNLKFQLPRILTNKGYGVDAGTGMKQDAQGNLSFDTSTKEGQMASAVANQYLDEYRGQIWSNRIETLAFDPKDGNVGKAVDTLEAHKDDMPVATYAKLSHQLSGPYRSEQARVGVDGLISAAKSSYNPTGETGPVYATNMGNVKQPDGTFANPTTPIDGVVLAANNLRSNYQGLTLSQIAAKWTGEGSDKVSAWIGNASKASGIAPGAVPDMNNPQVLQSLLKGVSVAEKSSEDRQAFSDQVISQGVSASLQGQKANLSNQAPKTVPSGAYQTDVDFLSQQEPQLIQQARDLAKHQGLDTTGQDLFAQRMEQRITEARSAQQGEVKAYKDTVLSNVMSGKTPITNEAMLDYSPDPNVKKAWVQLQAMDPYGAQGIRKIISANAQGKTDNYGTAIYPHLLSVLSGQVKDVSELQDYIGGKQSPISAGGVQLLSKELQNSQTPQGHAFAQAEASFLQGMQKTYTGAGLVPGMTSTSTTTEFNRALAEILPQIEAAKAAGKTATQMFSPQINGRDNPDYIQSSIKPPGLTELMKPNLRMLGGVNSVSTVSNPTNTPSTQASPANYKSVDDVGRAYQRGDLTRAQAHQIITDRFGGFIPSVPRPQ